MLFNQIEFVILISVVLLLHLACRGRGARNTILLAASYYFYAYWDWRFLGLILFSTAVDYVLGLAIYRSHKKSHKRAMLALSMISNLGLLGFFKYFNFFIESATPILESLGLGTGTLSIILPVGISFYTFQTMSYTIDVYRGDIKPCRNPRDFALFVAFFPQLVAGPIIRAAEILPQIEVNRKIRASSIELGFRQFVIGFFKKVFIADNLALFVDTQFANPGQFDTATTWLAVTAYALQIYCDFSGYSDMAIGVARSLGFEFKENFNVPYTATSVTEFWRRWHISLSTWLRDYLYIPLGGNRCSTPRVYTNLMLTMVLGGLWHGASWNFVFWGALHGFALIIHKAAMDLSRGRTVAPTQRTRVGRAISGWLITQLVVWVAWVFFRNTSFEGSWLMLSQMFTWSGGLSHISPFALGAVIAFTLHHMLIRSPLAPLVSLDIHRRETPALLLTMLGIAILFYPRGFQPFIYFQF